MVILAVLTVEQSTFSLQVIVALLFKATPAAPFVGTVLVIVGAVVSMVTVLPATGVSTLLDESVARLLMVYVPSAGNVHEYVHVTSAPGHPVQVAAFQCCCPR